MRFWLGLALGVAVGGGVAWWWMRPEETKPAAKEYPLLKYTIENLGRRIYGSEIVLDQEESDGVYRFHFDSDGKDVTGLAHIPGGCGKCPVIVQFRGYQEVEKYKSGGGTRRTAQEFAKAGFISLAPDFLGYGGSASPSANVWEARFETYTTALNLLSAISNWPLADFDRVGIWGHSNGGHIALAVLEITGKNYPTVLWAPVTAPFPYSVLYYTDDIEDHGKLLRKKLADFERDYDAESYSVQNYLDLITAPILLQQGTADDQVPAKWNQGLAKKLKNVEYVEYSGADHNLSLSWNRAMQDAVDFFKKSW
ncbi:hypothetical protein A2899_05105 [Candidatus Amesbacteria bacterium RIFCSPLOWO2_01_FULL_49_25]|uniref:Peptidase S9 prolyl oligopeptidase catalytic domain-containing protein n=1 Tax=Candidatus Amesbacteria bacterium RIFCSPHIGHO2_01_FULL_48_32b TaxID=1797253 RepID=A0A1F4YF30_9BACT|nr:MAG: hypothetical protein A2876_02855 [Candidatus Amesbacteria bacterium RIFCSPHIGHO2_01_FULL_48_32b]OGD07806.1 MAG: hypothetical protein A2899_05105 [Candidatus Amesbacteria bacterium RIFCSPLOWO2_01_FULL_49_25]